MSEPRFVAFLIGFLLATATIGPSKAQERIVLPGYSIMPPAGDKWTAQITEGSALFGRNIDADRGRLGLEKFHSFVLMTSGGLVGELPFENDERLLESFRSQLQAEYGVERLQSVSPSPEAKSYSDSTFCVDYEAKGNQKDNVSGEADKFFVLVVRGKRCLHATLPLYVTDLNYSQRSYKGDWVEAFDDEVRRFFDLQFLPVDLGPYVAEILTTYADALVKVGKQSEAEKIRKHAEILNKPNEGSSNYLGFDPADDLTAYSELLRVQGEQDSAARMSILAGKWTYNNVLAAAALNSTGGQQ